MLDRTPQWLEWAAYQAAMCDVDMARKIQTAITGGYSAEQDTDAMLADMGIGRKQ